jgi:hypothetical protein
VAWYCEDPAEPNNPEKSRANVGKICNRYGFNSCYNDLALAAHNVKRKHHNTDIMTLDQDAARAIQMEMNGANFEGLMPRPEDRDPTFEDCA